MANRKLFFNYLMATLCVVFLLYFVILQVPTAKAIDITSIGLHEASDSELDALLHAVIDEQRNRLGTKIIMEPETIEINKGSSVKISATLVGVPENLKAGKFTWSTSDKSVATVQNGTIRGVGQGTASISCSSVLSDGTEITSECKVTVIIAVKSVSFKTKKVSAELGELYAQEAIVSPGDATNPELLYSSSNEKIATVDNHGNVSIQSGGTVTITATSTDGSQKEGSYTLSISSIYPVINDVFSLSNNVKMGMTQDEVKEIEDGIKNSILKSKDTNKLSYWSPAINGIAFLDSSNGENTTYEFADDTKELYKVKYYFNEGKPSKNYKKLKSAFTSQYGKPLHSNDGEYFPLTTSVFDDFMKHRQENPAQYSMDYENWVVQYNDRFIVIELEMLQVKATAAGRIISLYPVFLGYRSVSYEEMRPYLLGGSNGLFVYGFQ